MKPSIITTLIIILFGLFTVQVNHRHLSRLRLIEVSLNKTAAGLGISRNSPTSMPKASYSSRSRQRHADPEVDIRQLANNLIEMVKMIPESESPKDRGELMNSLATLSEFSPSQIKSLLSEIHKSDGIDDELRKSVMGIVLILASDQNPRAGLDLVISSHDPNGSLMWEDAIINNALRSFANSDPAGALKWIEDNREVHPEVGQKENLEIALLGIAREQPGTAIQWLKNIDPSDRDDLAAKIAKNALSNEQRMAILEEINSSFVTSLDTTEMGKLKESVMAGLGASLDPDDFEGSTAWLENSDFSPEEISTITSGLALKNPCANTGEWISWMVSHLPDEALPNQVTKSFSTWTNNDYKTAGEWLESATDNAAKVPAISAYVSQIVFVKPQTAEKWALQLPEGPIRNSALKRIASVMESIYPGSEDAFKQRHGL
ncbi:hypothetical protein JIN85_07555 [Luteolibacter pohnpeiensis]|uniref:Uncharacterized protein n=1 Tax=Luteolibacter pohnpeiensis TaxID=454153 RepID=A0A934S332_9BACT|nr:hypothetical protein [Luteolibacter pohnpeiensis]MBK1882265.1 hypothetical protein [Luteolibacter pohnpeiensis]